MIHSVVDVVLWSVWCGGVAINVKVPGNLGHSED